MAVSRDYLMTYNDLVCTEIGEVYAMLPATKSGTQNKFARVPLTSCQYEYNAIVSVKYSAADDIGDCCHLTLPIRAQWPKFCELLS